MSLIKFTHPLTIYLPNDSEFVFRDGYSYMYDKVDDGIIVWNMDKSVSVRLSVEDVGKWCGDKNNC